MNPHTEIIRISDRPDGSHAVSARELYAFLQVKTDFSDWCKRMFEYGFDENSDYSLLKIGERKAHNKVDYALTLDCAKEIAMLQRTERGQQARRYFIEVERRYRQQSTAAGLALPDFSDPAAAARAWAEQWEGRKLAEQNVGELRERLEFFESLQTDNQPNLLDMNATAKLLRREGVGRTRLFELLRQHRWLRPNNEPYQTYIERDYFRLAECRWTDKDGTEHPYLKTMVTPRGLQAIERLLNQQRLHMAENTGYAPLAEAGRRGVLPFEELLPAATPPDAPASPKPMATAPSVLSVAPPAASVALFTKKPSLTVMVQDPADASPVLCFQFRGPQGRTLYFSLCGARNRLRKSIILLSRLKYKHYQQSTEYQPAVALYTGLCEFYDEEVSAAYLTLSDEHLPMFQKIQAAWLAQRKAKTKR